MRSLALAASFACLLALPAAAGPEVGQPAPAFKLADQNGVPHALEDYRGKWLVLYFYPKDDTPGCTTQACTFRDDIFKFRALGAQVVGVSIDDVGSHRSFAEKFSLPFPLLADADKQVAEAYGVLGLGGLYAKRETFLIDPQGVVAMHYPGVKPAENSAQVLADLRRLQRPR
jgi:peroxiredoxin Q/BCP